MSKQAICNAKHPDLDGAACKSVRGHDGHHIALHDGVRVWWENPLTPLPDIEIPPGE